MENFIFCAVPKRDIILLSFLNIELLSQEKIY